MTNKEIKDFIIEYFKKYDQEINEYEEDDYFKSNVVSDLRIEEMTDGIRIYTDGVLYDLFESDGIDCEYGYFENDFPEKFEKALTEKGLFYEPYSPGIYHIVNE